MPAPPPDGVGIDEALLVPWLTVPTAPLRCPEHPATSDTCGVPNHRRRSSSVSVPTSAFAGLRLPSEESRALDTGPVAEKAPGNSTEGNKPRERAAATFTCPVHSPTHPQSAVQRSDGDLSSRTNHRCNKNSLSVLPMSDRTTIESPDSTLFEDSNDLQERRRLTVILALIVLVAIAPFAVGACSHAPRKDTSTAPTSVARQDTFVSSEIGIQLELNAELHDAGGIVAVYFAGPDGTRNIAISTPTLNRQFPACDPSGEKQFGVPTQYLGIVTRADASRRAAPQEAIVQTFPESYLSYTRNPEVCAPSDQALWTRTHDAVLGALKTARPR